MTPFEQFVSDRISQPHYFTWRLAVLAAFFGIAVFGAGILP